MNNNFIEQKGFGEWYKYLDSTYNLMESNDIDSHFSSILLRDRYDCQINLFNSFSTIYYREGIDLNSITPQSIIGIDVDLSKNKCYGNHITYLQNNDCISLNRGLVGGSNQYYKKFAGSTLLTIMSLYKMDLSNYTEEQLEILISVDTAFKQYSFNKDLFKEYYNDILEYPIFSEIVSKHDDQYFYDIIIKYKLHEGIKVNDKGYLETKIELDKLSEIFNINLSLPTERFIPFYNMQTVGLGEEIFRERFKENENKIFSSAYTKKGYVVASIKFENIK